MFRRGGLSDEFQIFCLRKESLNEIDPLNCSLIIFHTGTGGVSVIQICHGSKPKLHFGAWLPSIL